MRNIHRSVTWILFASCAMLYSVRSACVQKQAGDRVWTTFEFRSGSVTLHEPVYIDFLIHNGLPEAVQFDLGANSRAKFIFSIQDPTGATHRVGPLKEPPFSARGHIELLPGKSYESVLLLNRWYQFNAPGKYRVLPSLATSIGSTAGAVTAAGVSRELSIEVLPREPTRLRSVCAGLATIATSASTGKALDAAETLSYVLDLEAVPYLIKVAQAGDTPLRSIAVDGLARISRRKGLESVFREAGPVNAQLRSAVKQAVYNMEHGVIAVD